ncbi:signal peptidase I [Candidatus Gottesmanbacteria bacterium RIFCSPHIGHO2_02_FULL_40_24]|uniref:Signal peptidase I n=1 Tax=Candidatus Gottesmanbacteria bacterium RIFCSPHIGHO2_01_FULL_40_15 TaxID=1798376 RepID=A0A1F5Z767_9BACT|nr:MAG: signal peptidase I [Candidatus Gottesmanbacteria bacterium RIFCSPHIGHO2_01_FULL_40_15]OGG18099.1 MAG: signal peptidase I [Candidatus Gottesmanbacteria bacterium RIFCSPHIGHO2_02_FULL_40_24]OGG25042.1 MAG: signal peptidase I [Candidatus Gottesmanbacteria bacterium RIFCSPHIGHO2_12_FULL_40_13]OGG33870.1 MAG: signal peptidase I [Candidatus Gottesmanbacteria bacterium RIFCSPLOWO2_02_FULL_40_10]
MRSFVFYFSVLLIIGFLGFRFSPLAYSLMQNSGIVGEEVPVSGTGSMYPTFPKAEGVTEKEASAQTVARPKMLRYPAGINLMGKRFFSYKLQRGDIVEFENDLTRQLTDEKYGTATGFVKRIIGLPGDSVELRDGYVYSNGKILTEPYTAKPRSTYGGDFTPDCSVVKIPASSYFVLGDNRKASLDSRFDIGFVKETDIHHVLPLHDQEIYKSKWRDSKDDQLAAHKTTTDAQDFVFQLNEVRLAKNLKKLNLDNLLNKSSRIRGDIILETDDFSSEASRSGLTLEKSIRQSGYRNIIFAEVFTRGYYEAGELLENFFEFPDTEKLLLSNEYQDIGLSAVIKDVNGCPTQVVVIHLGGYKAPNYQSEDVKSWQTLIANLTDILPGWESLSGVEGVNQEKLNRLLTVLRTRLENARRIYKRIFDNQWLTDGEKNLIEQDKALHSEAEKLITELNR